MLSLKDSVIAALAVLFIFVGTGWYMTNNKLKWANQMIVTNEALYKQAQAEYTAKALAEKARLETENEERSKKADASYRELLGQYNASIVRYQTSQREISRYYTSTLNQAAASPAGPSQSTDVLTIPLEDAKICAENTARLSAAHDWALTLK